MRKRDGSMYWYGSLENKQIFENAVLNYYNTTFKNLPEFLTIQNDKIEINNKMSDKLYVKESDVPKTNTRIAFVRKFIESKAPSYYDEACTDCQCSSARNRSITELHQIVLSRFPKTSFEAIVRIVRDLIQDAKPICMCYCTTINKVVLYYTDNATRQYVTDHSTKHYLDKEGLDAYSLNDYLTMMENIK